MFLRCGGRVWGQEAQAAPGLAQRGQRGAFARGGGDGAGFGNRRQRQPRGARAAAAAAGAHPLGGGATWRPRAERPAQSPPSSFSLLLLSPSRQLCSGQLPGACLLLRQGPTSAGRENTSAANDREDTKSFVVGGVL